MSSQEKQSAFKKDEDTKDSSIEYSDWIEQAANRCPDLKKMVEQARESDLGREQLEQIIDYHLKLNSEKERLNEMI